MADGVPTQVRQLVKIEPETGLKWTFVAAAPVRKAIVHQQSVLFVQGMETEQEQRAGGTHQNIRFFKCQVALYGQQLSCFGVVDAVVFAIGYKGGRLFEQALKRTLFATVVEMGNPQPLRQRIVDPCQCHRTFGKVTEYVFLKKCRRIEVS